MQFNPVTVEEDARKILHDWVSSESLRTHCESVAASMRHMARKHGENEQLWSAVGLLHDADYEKHPNLELSETGHPFVIVPWLRERGWPEEVMRAILSHADYSGVPRETILEKSLYACDELSGFVYAVALVRPSKSIHDVDVKSVKKKMKDKGFAAKVNREDILRGADELAVPVDELIGEVIAALREAAPQLGLEGQQPFVV
jgi:putative nucleotidyltransferase with HDIG domain